MTHYRSAPKKCQDQLEEELNRPLQSCDNTCLLFVYVCLYVYVCPPICSNIPNRSTFVCPFCGARNLDQQELVKHCMDNHRNDPNKVVRGYSVKHYITFLSRLTQVILNHQKCFHSHTAYCINMEACCNLMPSNNSYVADFVDHLKKKVKRVYTITATPVLVLPRTFIACHASLSSTFYLL